MPDNKSSVEAWQIALGLGALGGLMYFIYSSDDDEEGVSGGLEDYYNPQDYTFDSEEDAIKAKRIVVMNASKHGEDINPIIQEVDEGTFLLLFEDQDAPGEHKMWDTQARYLPIKEELSPLFSEWSPNEIRKAAEEALKPRRKQNVLKDILPPGMTLKRLQEIVRR